VTTNLFNSEHKSTNYTQKAIELSRTKLDDELSKISELFDTVERLQRSTVNILKKETETIEYWKEQIDKDYRWVAEGPLQNNMLTLTGNYYPDKNYSSKYFEEKTIELEKRKDEIYQSIEDINNIITRNEQNTSIHELSEAIKLQHEWFLNLANALAIKHEEVEEMREAYIDREGVDVFTESEKVEDSIIEESVTGLPGMVDFVPQQQQQSDQKQGSSNTGFGFGGDSGGSSSGFNFGSSSGSGGGFDFGGSSGGGGFSSGNSSSGGGFNFDNSSSNSGGGFSFGSDSNNTSFGSNDKKKRK
jgi:hypothetical protein